MPTIADFRVIEADSITFSTPEPNPFSPPEEVVYTFDAPAVDAESRSVAFFRLHPTVGETDCTVQMSLNGTEIFSRTLAVGIERSMHVAIPRGLVEASDNSFAVSKTDGGVVLVVSEIVVFFQANI